MTSWIGFIWLRTGISGDVFCIRKSNDVKFLEKLKYLTFVGPCVVIYSYSKTNKMHLFLKLLNCNSM
jgi:hypothetical protein